MKGLLILTALILCDLKKLEQTIANTNICINRISLQRIQLSNAWLHRTYAPNLVRIGLDYVSCSPFRVPIARLAAAQSALKAQGEQITETRVAKPRMPSFGPW